MAGGHDETVASTLPAVAGDGAPVVEVIANRYRLIRWLGGGGMGRVYEVLDTELDERVALKVLKAGLSDDAIERFRREVRLTRRIQHKNVARMFDIGQHVTPAGADKFLTMELVDGPALTREMGAPLGWPRVQKLATQICDGLAAAHALGVIHRDLKPDNILVEKGTDRAVITDFGIARTADDESVTQVGAVIGTPRYMAPEQLAGSEIDARVDIFSLGVMLFELASGKRPWSGDNLIAIAVAQQTKEPRALVAPGFPPAFEDLVRRCIAIDRDQRIASATDISSALAGMTISEAAPRPAGKPTMTPAIGSPTLTPSSTLGGTTLPTQVVEETTIAVLPFSCAPADEYLADGAFEDVIDTLSTTQGLRVKPAGVARGSAADPRALGQQLLVDLVVAGSLRRTPTGLRVSARLIAVADGFQIWAQKIDGTEADLLATSEQLSHGIAEALSAKAKAAATRAMDPRAVDLYLRAKAEQRRFWGEHQQNAKTLLEQAMEIAPSSPQIIGAHAYATVHTWIRQSAPELLPQAEMAVERALATGHADGYLAAVSLRLNRGDHVGAGTALGTAHKRAPMNAHVNEMVGRMLSEIESISNGRHYLGVALGLDASRWPVIDSDLVRLDAMEGNWDGAEARIQRLVTDPDPALVQLGSVYRARLAMWRRDDVSLRAGVAKLASRMGSGGTDQLRFYQRWSAGDPVTSEEWRAHADGLVNLDLAYRLQTINLQRMVEMGVVMERLDDAWYALALANTTGLIDVVWIDHCPLFAPHANDPTFRALRDQVAQRAREMFAAMRAA